MAKKMNKLPGVLSFQRCLLVTDGLFYNELDNGNLSPLWGDEARHPWNAEHQQSQQRRTSGFRQRQAR